MISNDAPSIVGRCKTLKEYWAPRDSAMKRWYRLIEMVDELKTDKMESFVGNDPRALYNLVLHLLDAPIPHRIKDIDMTDMESANAAGSVTKLFKDVWANTSRTYRHSNPRQSLMRTFIGYMLATGWYAMFSMVTDDGDSCYKEPWNPMEVYPVWDGTLGLSEVAHIFTASSSQCISMAKKNNWNFRNPYSQWKASVGRNVSIYDYWWVDIADVFPFWPTVWNAIVIDSELVKFEPTRFSKIPIYVSPVGGLPDMGALTEGNIPTYSSTLKLQAQESTPDRWKAEIGQAIVATNEHIYRTWNKWWSFSLQLLRDTAQPRIFERSRSGKAIVRPEDVFRRGAIFRGGPDDSVDFIGTPALPLELRSTQLDLEAMMQRGGVSWSMFGNVQGQISLSVMSQIAASANQVTRPFHQAVQDALSDMDNDDLADIRNRGVRPYGWKYPNGLQENALVSADYEVEIPGDLVNRATTARMLDPDFRLSYSYVVNKLFPDIGDPLRERAQVRADMAELHPTNATIALVQYYQRQAAYLTENGDAESARLYETAAESAMAMLMPQQPESVPGASRPTPNRSPLALPEQGV